MPPTRDPERSLMNVVCKGKDLRWHRQHEWRHGNSAHVSHGNMRKQWFRFPTRTWGTSNYGATNLWHQVVLLEWNFSSTNKTTKTPYGLKPLITNSPESWHAGTKRTLLPGSKPTWLSARCTPTGIFRWAATREYHHGHEAKLSRQE